MRTLILTLALMLIAPAADAAEGDKPKESKHHSSSSSSSKRKSKKKPKPGDAKPADADAKPAEVKPADVKPAEVKPVETKPAEPKAATLDTAFPDSPPPSKPLPAIVAPPPEVKPAPPPAIVAPPIRVLSGKVEKATYRRRYGLMAGGLVLFALGYFGNIGVTYGFQHDPPGTSAIPLVGPFVQMAESWRLPAEPKVDSGDPSFDKKTRENINTANGILEPVSYAWLSLSAILQVGGATMAILGGVLKKKLVTYEDARASLIIVPTAGGALLHVTF